MHAAPRSIRSVTAACMVVYLFLAVVPSALAAVAANPQISPPNPVAGDTVTYIGGGSVDCQATYTFTVTYHNPTGPPTVTSSTPSGTYQQYSFPVPKAGDYTVAENTTSSNPNCTTQRSADFTVGEGLGGSISVSPDPAVVNQSANLNVVPTGGNPGYTFSWDLNDDGTFGDATTHNPTTTFTTSGSHTVRVRITDTSAGGNPSHTTTVVKTIDVVTPSTTTGTTTSATPPPCVSTVAFKLSEFKTTGCFTQVSSSPNQWTTTSAVTLNGMSLPDYGQTFTITGPTPGEPGGHFSAPNSTIQLDTFTAFSGNIDWSLPDGGPNQEQVVPGKSISVAAGSSLLGLNVRGEIALKLGADSGVTENVNGYQTGSGGKFYADFPLTIELPVGFKAGPENGFGTVTGSASLRVDDGGVHYDGLRLEAKDVWLGKLNVKSVCFSYIPANGMSTAPCDTPSFGDPSVGDTSLNAKAPPSDQSFIKCASDATTNRWDASAEVVVPSGLGLGAFGGLANGQLSKLGASISGLDRRVPLGYGVYLDSISFGLCLSPPPLTIKAKVGADFFGASNLVNLAGSFTYTDAVGYNPWSLQLDADVSIGKGKEALPIGHGMLGFNGNGVVDFSLGAGVNVLNGFASLNARVYGYVDAQHNQFLVGGEGQGCLNGAGCVTASGELSSTGVAGCLTIGSSLPTYNLIIPLDGSPVYLDTSTYPLTAGFGYAWGASSAHLLGSTCDFSPYQPTLSAAAAQVRAARSGIPVRIAAGTNAIALRIHGTNGPPKIVIRGPGGTTIASPSHRLGKFSKGHYLLAENRSDGTTDVLIVRPAAGTWTVSRAPGAASSPTTIDRAKLEAPPTFGARVLRKSGVRTLQVAYAVPPGTSVQLIERAKGIRQTLVRSLHGHRCPVPPAAKLSEETREHPMLGARGHALPKMRPGTDEQILCASVRFRPSRGPGGTREVQAVVTRRGIPLLQKNIAFFRAARQTLPSRVGTLRAQRSSGSLVIAFSPSTGASRYAVSAKLSDGRELAFDLGGGCRALRIASVPAGDAAKIKIAGVRYDLAPGPLRTVSIKANAQSTGSKKLPPGKICT